MNRTIAYAAATAAAAGSLVASAGLASASTQPGPAPQPSHSVTLRDAAGQYVQVNHDRVSVGRNAARFTEVPQRHGGYELQYGQGRSAEFLTVSQFGASLSHRAGTVFGNGQLQRGGYSTIKINRELLTAQGSRLTAAPQTHRGPSAQQEWAGLNSR